MRFSSSICAVAALVLVPVLFAQESTPVEEPQKAGEPSAEPSAGPSAGAPAVLAEPSAEPITALPDLPPGHIGDPQVHALGLPSPPEYFLTLAKSTNARWRKSYRVLEPQPPADRSKAAAGIGMLVAECHVAAMARDGQRLSNVSAEITSFAKVLGVGKVVKPGVVSLNAHVELTNWGAVHVDLETLLAGISASLREQRDDDLATLVTLGCWLRTLHVGCGVVATGEVEDLTLAVGGEGVPQYMTLLAGKLSERSQKHPPVEFMLRQGEKLARVWAPEKMAVGRKFTTAEVKDSLERLESMIGHLSK